MDNESHRFLYPDPTNLDPANGPVETYLIQSRMEGRCAECGAKVGFEVSIGQMAIALAGWSTESDE